jgi:hypothetical protein
LRKLSSTSRALNTRRVSLPTQSRE